MDSQLKFHAIQSFVDSSFFTHLSQKKLNEYKLDSAPIPIHGFMMQPLKLNKFNDKPVLNLDYNSFEPEYIDRLVKFVKGTLFNVNTIEEFKALDKKALLKEWGTDLYRGVQDGHVAEKFYVLSFSDLKKYRFYYWLAFPVLHSTWHIRKSHQEYRYLSEIEGMSKESHVLFFQIHETQIGPECKVNNFSPDGTFVFVDTCLSADGSPSIQLKNYLYLLGHQGFRTAELIIFRKDNASTCLELELDTNFRAENDPQIVGWERTAQGKLGPKVADLGALIDQEKLADQAVDLNLKLMKWRVAPELDLDVLKRQKVLLLGAGTLGSYVSRALMGWGVRSIDFVDNGRVSYLNPVRQPLFTFKDCFGDGNQGWSKAIRASEVLKEIFPGASLRGYNMEVPMIGHPISDSSETDVKQSFETLEKLFLTHDVVFLLMDSREARWLPTLMGVALNKTVINAALGYDSYLVLRHSPLDMQDRLGCYYCNDVVAPTDSLSDRSLDQMCTVTRPGGALMASLLAVELLVSLLQHDLKNRAPHNAQSKFGAIPHQIRGFLRNFSQTKLSTPAYQNCSACSETIVELYNAGKWEFVRNCLNDIAYLEEVSGLKRVQEEADKAAAAMMDDLLLSDDDF